VTHRLPAARFAEGMAMLQRRDDQALKIVLEWPSPAPAAAR
jgi:hypothetical protein